VRLENLKGVKCAGLVPGTGKCLGCGEISTSPLERITYKWPTIVGMGEIISTDGTA